MFCVRYFATPILCVRYFATSICCLSMFCLQYFATLIYCLRYVFHFDILYFDIRYSIFCSFNIFLLIYIFVHQCFCEFDILRFDIMRFDVLSWKHGTRWGYKGRRKEGWKEEEVMKESTKELRTNYTTYRDLSLDLKCLPAPSLSAVLFLFCPENWTPAFLLCITWSGDLAK